MQESPFKRHEPLYLKYRPQALEELVGQEGVYRTLVNAIENNRLTHAYLFTGPRGTGKTSSARILAKSLNCKSTGKPVVKPCQTCTCCLEITAGNSPAVFEIDAASNNSVDDARMLIERAPLKAVGGEFKVYIIDECHMLTKEAFNALLKTIEQPPPGVVFILATTEEHKVLPTIVSRCQRLMFKLINQEALTKHLRSVADKESIEIEDDAISLIARRSGGGLRDALSNLDQASLLSSTGKPASVNDLLRLLGALHEDVLLRISEQIAKREGNSVIESVSKLLGEGREPQVVLQELSQHFLNMMKASYLAAAKQDDLALAGVVLGSKDYISGLLDQQSQFERAELSQIVESIDRLEQTCRRSSQPAMHLEVGLLGLCHRHDIHLVKDLVERVSKLEEMVAQGANFDSGAARASHHVQARVLPAPAPAQSHAPSQPAAPPQRPMAAVPPPAQHISPEAHQAAAQAPHAPTASEPTQAEPAVAAQSQGTANDEAAYQDDYSEAGESAAAPQGGDFSNDIEYLWQQILDELQRRHLPTFSLTSTHAFPLSTSGKELNVGVLKDNLQKMLESKMDHIKAAAKAVTGTEMQIKIKVAEQTAPAKKSSSAAARTSAPMPRPSGEAPPVQQSSAAATAPSPGEQTSQPPRPSLGANPDEVGDSTMVKEAYKLFEGPGSRRLT